MKIYLIKKEKNPIDVWLVRWSNYEIFDWIKQPCRHSAALPTAVYSIIGQAHAILAQVRSRCYKS